MNSHVKDVGRELRPLPPLEEPKGAHIIQDANEAIAVAHAFAAKIATTVLLGNVERSSTPPWTLA